MERGYLNSVMMKQMKCQRVRECSQKVPEVEFLRKLEADRSYSMWERYLIKHRDLNKRTKKCEKVKILVIQGKTEKK